ncbi:MAG TPA: glycosyltransferase family 4 protein [Thiobacillaceae bacterium]|nr:glycosyltransferase family 4 protein [Thiobacillaceae bacterium]
MGRLTVVQMLPALESGGVERGTLEVGKHLVDHGHRSIVISAGGRMVEQLRREGSEHLAWDVGRKSPMTLLRYVGRLRRFLADESVDILHLRSRMPAWVAWLAWRGMEPATRPRLVTTVHGLYSVNAYSAIMAKGERVIVVSKTVRDYVLQNYPRTEPGRITVIPRGIDPAAYPWGYRPTESWLADWRTQYPQLAGRKVITLPGRITRLKGHEDFIKLIGRLKAAGGPVHGLVVGGAEAKKQAYLAELENKVAVAGLAQDITFTGQRGDLREIMAVSDLVLSLSNKPESFGRTVLEALSMGVPVVGYDHGGVGEQLQLLHSRGLVGLGDLEGLLRQCRSALGMGRIALASSPPTLEHMLSDTLAVYESFF